MVDELPQLIAGDEIKERYQVVRKLGEGGFGAVYSVLDTATRQTYAMKVEGAREQIQVLKMEVMVLKECKEKQGGRHVCRIVDKGRNDVYNYVIMTLVGQSLGDLRKACPSSRFTLGTALRTGIQCLEALEDLHKIGYLHRDVKPGNFAAGREEVKEQKTIYILDFGLARKFINERGVIRTPRSTAGFRGTVRYAPLNCHHNRELSRKDDLETWFYQQIEITKGRLPWSAVPEKVEVGKCKFKARKSGELCKDTPGQYATMIQYIDGLKYWDAPDYGYIYGLLRHTMTENGCRENAPYDWEKGGQHRKHTQMLPPPEYNPHGDAPLVNF